MQKRVQLFVRNVSIGFEVNIRRNKTVLNRLKTGTLLKPDASVMSCKNRFRRSPESGDLPDYYGARTIV